MTVPEHDDIPKELEGDYDPEEEFEFDATSGDLTDAVFGKVQKGHEAGV